MPVISPEATEEEPEFGQGRCWDVWVHTPMLNKQREAGEFCDEHDCSKVICEDFEHAASEASAA